MSTRDLLLTKVEADEAKHDQVAVQKDVTAILQRDTNLADPKMREEKIQHDMNVLRDFGVSDKELRNLGFPDTDHMMKMMNVIAADEKHSTRAALPGVKLDAKERDLAASMERAILEGNLDRLDNVAQYFEKNSGEFEKLAKVVAVDLKQFGVDVSTHKGKDNTGDLVIMDVKVKAVDGATLDYGVSTSYASGDNAYTVGKDGHVVNNTAAMSSGGYALRERIATQASKLI